MARGYGDGRCELSFQHIQLAYETGKAFDIPLKTLKT